VKKGQNNIPKTFNERPGMAKTAEAEKMRKSKVRRLEVENITAHPWVRRN
jgi:hypothetical protein